MIEYFFFFTLYVIYNENGWYFLEPGCVGTAALASLVKIHDFFSVIVFLSASTLEKQNAGDQQLLQWLHGMSSIV